MLQSGFDAAGMTNRKVCLSMKWDWERARERLISKKYQKYYWLAYMAGVNHQYSVYCDRWVYNH